MAAKLPALLILMRALLPIVVETYIAEGYATRNEIFANDENAESLFGFDVFWLAGGRRLVDDAAFRRVFKRVASRGPWKEKSAQYFNDAKYLSTLLDVLRSLERDEAEGN